MWKWVGQRQVSERSSNSFVPSNRFTVFFVLLVDLLALLKMWQIVSRPTVCFLFLYDFFFFLRFPRSQIVSVTFYPQGKIRKKHWNKPSDVSCQDDLSHGTSLQNGTFCIEELSKHEGMIWVHLQAYLSIWGQIRRITKGVATNGRVLSFIGEVREDLCKCSLE